MIFTVNGMAMNRYGEVIDLVGGRRDIKHKMLQTIGNAQERFKEDALRLFRRAVLWQSWFLAE